MWGRLPGAVPRLGYRNRTDTMLLWARLMWLRLKRLQRTLVLLMTLLL
jgi:hypothetical protein